MKLTVIIVSATLFLILFSPVIMALSLGGAIPPFRVVTGDGMALRKSDLLGSISIIFYDTPQSAEINASLKYALGDLMQRNQDRYRIVQFVQIVDASSANFLTRTIWKRILLKKSREIGIPIYADWSGSLINKLGLVRGASNVLIVDREGILRYREAGPIQNENLDRFYSILEELVSDAWVAS